MLRLKKQPKKEKLLLISLTLIFAGILALIAIYILQMDGRTIKADLYRYEHGHRFDYFDSSRIFKSGDKTVLRNGGYLHLLTAAPLYYQDRERLFIPEGMAVYSPAKNSLGKVTNFTEIYQEKNGIFAESTYKRIRLEAGFLYDGSNLYIFLERTIVKWSDNTVVLEPFSYAVVIYNKSLELYPKEAGLVILEDTGNSIVSAEMENGYSVNMSTDILCGADGKEQLLFSQISALEKLE
jgi:hypothetical protein